MPEQAVKRGRGRPRLPETKQRVNFRMKQAVIDTVAELKSRGKYSSQDAVIEHTIMHASTCEGFTPGEPGLAWTKEGEVESVDMSEL